MTDSTDDLAGIEVAARELVPELTERLARHGLREIEVRRGDLRVRVAAAISTASAQGEIARGAAIAPAGGLHLGGHAAAHAGGSVGHGHPTDAQAVASPGVGYFIYADGLGPGQTVEKGDALGYVDVLGVRHDVRAPRAGVVRNLVTETGEAVEYGQVLIELEVPTS